MRLTRTEFINCIESWDDLIGFCINVSCEICDNVIDRESLDEAIEDDIIEAVEGGMSWLEVRERLCGIDTGYAYYEVEGYMCFKGLSGMDFQSYKRKVASWGNEYNIWDYDDDEEEVAEDQSFSSDTEFSVYDLISQCAV